MSKNLTRKEIDDLKNEISFRNTMTKKLGTWIKIFGSFSILFIALAIWGFLGLEDNFLNVSESFRNVIKWVSVVLAVPSVVLFVMFSISFTRSKKSTLKLIEYLESRHK